eukprot:2558165-Lingulodinium_polyedra.AAC.1
MDDYRRGLSHGHGDGRQDGSTGGGFQTQGEGQEQGRPPSGGCDGGSCGSRGAEAQGPHREGPAAQKGL